MQSSILPFISSALTYPLLSTKAEDLSRRDGCSLCMIIKDDGNQYLSCLSLNRSQNRSLDRGSIFLPSKRTSKLGRLEPKTRQVGQAETCDSSRGLVTRNNSNFSSSHAVTSSSHGILGQRSHRSLHTTSEWGRSRARFPFTSCIPRAIAFFAPCVISCPMPRAIEFAVRCLDPSVRSSRACFLNINVSK